MTKPSRAKRPARKARELVIDQDGLATIRLLCSISAGTKPRQPHRCEPGLASRLIDKQLAHQPLDWLKEQHAARAAASEAVTNS